MAIIAAFPGGGGGKICSGVTTGTASALTLTYTGFKLEDGVAVRFRLHIDSGATPTLNVNGTGAKKIVTMDGADLPAGIKAGTWLTAVYSGTLGFFVLQGSVYSKANQSRYGNGVGQISVYESILVPMDTNYDRSTWI